MTGEHSKFSDARGIDAPGGPALGEPPYENLSDPMTLYHDPAHTSAVVVLSGSTDFSGLREAFTAQGLAPYDELLPHDDQEPTVPLRRPSEGRGRIRERLAGMTAGGFALERAVDPGRRGGKLHWRRPPLPDPVTPDNDGTPPSNHEQQGEQ